MIRILAMLTLTALAIACAPEPAPVREEPLSDEGPDGVRRIPIETPAGTFEVWTRRVGENPDVKLLLLHGGPGATHEYFEIFEQFLPDAGYELYYYDQLGSGESDRPDPTELLEIPRFVDEVEQVRKALGLDADNFFLLGHSWGGILAIEYALEHQQHLRGLVVSNMMASIPAYNRYANDVLMASMDPEVLAELRAIEAAEDYENPRYMELLMEHHYVDHVLRKPADQWPDAVNRAFANINPEIYIPMQGPSELGASGKLADWARTGDLERIEVPTLVIGAAHDTMNPEHMVWMSNAFPDGRYAHCPDGGHLAMWDDTEAYFEGLLGFLREVGDGE